MFECYQLSLLSAAVGFPVNRCILEASVLLGAYVDTHSHIEGRGADAVRCSCRCSCSNSGSSIAVKGDRSVSPTYKSSGVGLAVS